MRYVAWGGKAGFRASANPIKYVKNDKFFMIVVRSCHDIGEGSEKIHAEGTVGLSSAGRHKLQERLDKFFGLRVIEELDARVLAFARDTRTVSDRDRVMSLHVRTIVAPLVPDDVSGLLAGNPPVPPLGGA